MSDDENEALEALEQEVELLEAVFTADEIVITRPDDRGVSVVLHLTPLTGMDDTTAFVRCDLIMTTDESYPSNSPGIDIGSSRGKSCAVLLSL